MKEGRIRPSLQGAEGPPRPAAEDLNEGGSNSTLVALYLGRYHMGTIHLNEGGSNSTLVAGERRLPSDRAVDTSMKEGRIRPSLAGTGEGINPLLANLNEGGSNSTLVAELDLECAKRSLTSMKEGRIRPSLSNLDTAPSQ